MERGGEDAFFVSSYNGGIIAVADGVSGYETLFSKDIPFPSIQENLMFLSKVASKKLHLFQFSHQEL